MSTPVRIFANSASRNVSQTGVAGTARLRSKLATVDKNHTKSTISNPPPRILEDGSTIAERTLSNGRRLLIHRRPNSARSENLSASNVASLLARTRSQQQQGQSEAAVTRWLSSLETAEASISSGPAPWSSPVIGTPPRRTEQSVRSSSWGSAIVGTPPRPSQQSEQSEKSSLWDAAVEGTPPRQQQRSCNNNEGTATIRSS